MKLSRHERTALLAGFVLGLVLGFSLMLQGDTTGYITFEDTETGVPVTLTFTENTTYPLNLTDLTGLKVSGTGTGSGSIWLRVGDERLLVHSYLVEEDRYKVTTDKTSYALNETVNVTVTPADAAYTLWLENAAGQRIVVPEAFHLDEPGTFTLDALINDTGNITITSTDLTIRNDTNTSEGSIREIAEDHATFTAACAESCSFNGTNKTYALEIETTGNVAITELVTVTLAENAEPVQSRALPNVTVSEGGNTTINLDPYFTDPDGDTLTYDYRNAAGVQMSIDGDALTITGLEAGTGESVIYASDLTHLVQSNPFTITVTPGTTNGTTIVPDPNTTDNKTAYVNETLIEIPVETCDDADVNRRPENCFAGIEDKVYTDVVAFLRDKNMDRVGRFTRFGNLIIEGVVHEAAIGDPAASDFSLGVTRDVEFEEVYTPTIWIDSSTGDLHLTGKLYQEQHNLAPPQYNSYSISNEHGLVLGYFDQKTGDLYLKGNIVQLGKI